MTAAERHEVDLKVLSVLDEPKKNAAIVGLTKLHYTDVGASLKRLRDAGMVISSGFTAATQHERVERVVISRLIGELVELRKEIAELRLAIARIPIP